MSPNTVIHKLNELKDQQSRLSKHEAIDRAIKAVEAHEVAKECVIIEKEKPFFSDGVQGAVDGTARIPIYCCPNCGNNIRIKSFALGIHKGNPFPNYCSNCGQKLKAPRE